jgi:hypothetical protein
MNQPAPWDREDSLSVKIAERASRRRAARVRRRAMAAAALDARPSAASMGAAERGTGAPEAAPTAIKSRSGNAIPRAAGPGCQRRRPVAPDRAARAKRSAESRAISRGERPKNREAHRPSPVSPRASAPGAASLRDCHGEMVPTRAPSGRLQPWGWQLGCHHCDGPSRNTTLPPGSGGPVRAGGPESDRC